MTDNMNGNYYFQFVGNKIIAWMVLDFVFYSELIGLQYYNFCRYDMFWLRSNTSKGTYYRIFQFIGNRTKMIHKDDHRNIFFPRLEFMKFTILTSKP